MAIFADYTKTTYTEHKTETVVEQVAYSSDLHEGHPKYEYRGQTINETLPLIVENSTTLTNAYIVITITNYYKHQKDDFNNTLFDFSFFVYNNKQQYLDDINDYVYEDDVIGQFYNLTSADDLRVKAYEILKNQPYLSNIIDD
jgi:hypothetical protein